MAMSKWLASVYRQSLKPQTSRLTPNFINTFPISTVFGDRLWWLMPAGVMGLQVPHFKQINLMGSASSNPEFSTILHNRSLHFSHCVSSATTARAPRKTCFTAVVDDLNNNHNNNKDGAMTKAHLPHSYTQSRLQRRRILTGSVTGARALVFVFRAC